MQTNLGETRLGRALAPALGVAGVAALSAAVVWILVLAYRRPVLNFDLVDYVALAIEWREDDPAAVHRRTYEVLEAELPPEVFADFTHGGSPTPGGPFRERITRDLAAFQANLGFHRGRYLYTLAVAGLHGLGVPLVAATQVPNLVFWPLTALLALWWTRRHLGLGAGALVTLAILYAPPVLSVAPASSPDGMAMFLVALALYLLVERRSFRWCAGLLLLLILVRSDFVLICGGLAAAAFVGIERERRPPLAALGGWLAGCTALYLLVSRSAGDPGWWAAFTGMQRRVGDFDELIPFRVTFYLRGLQEKLSVAHYLGYDMPKTGGFVLGSSFVLTYLGAAVAGVALGLCSRVRALDVHVAVLAGLLLSSAARWAVFPFLFDRYFVYLWVPVPLCLVALGATLAQRARASEPTAS